MLMLQLVYMNERKSNVRALFAKDREEVAALVAETENRSEDPSYKIDAILRVITSLEGPNSDRFNAVLAERLEDWRAESAQTEASDQYVLDKLNEVITKYPALQVALGRRSMRPDSSEPYDPFSNL